MGKLIILKLGLRHERMVAEWCEEAIEALSALANKGHVVALDEARGESEG